MRVWYLINLLSLIISWPSSQVDRCIFCYCFSAFFFISNYKKIRWGKYIWNTDVKYFEFFQVQCNKRCLGTWGQSALVFIYSFPDDNWMRGMSAWKVFLSRVGQQYADGANLTTQGRTLESSPIELILHTYGKAAGDIKMFGTLKSSLWQDSERDVRDREQQLSMAVELQVYM